MASAMTRWTPDFSWLPAALSAAGLTKQELGKRLQRYHSAVTDLLSGKRQLALHELPVLADSIGLSVSDVLGRAGLEEGRRAAALLAAAGTQPLLDRALMREVTAATKRWLDDRGEDLPPDAWADLILVLYDMAARDRARDRAAPVGPAAMPSLVELAKPFPGTAKKSRST